MRSVSAIRNILANAANAIAGNPFRVRQGVFGAKLVMTGAWDSRVACYMRDADILELELSYVNGFRPGADSIDFLADLPQLLGLRLALPSLELLSPINQLSQLRYLSIDLSRSARGLDFALLPRLENVALEWFKGADGLFSLKELRKLSLFHYPGLDGSKRFSAFEKLEELRLSVCALEEIENFRFMTRLWRLELLRLKRLRSLHGIEPMSELKKLRIESCPNIQTLDPVERLNALEFLWLYDCGKIASLAPIRHLTQMENLLLGGNTNILDGDMQVLESLPNLKRKGIVDRKHYSQYRK